MNVIAIVFVCLHYLFCVFACLFGLFVGLVCLGCLQHPVVNLWVPTSRPFRQRIMPEELCSWQVVMIGRSDRQTGGKWYDHQVSFFTKTLVICCI